MKDKEKKIVKNRYGTWERTTFNKLKLGDLFTIRKEANITGEYNDDRLLRYDNEFNYQKLNCLCYGGAWFRINNKRTIVWKNI